MSFHCHALVVWTLGINPTQMNIKIHNNNNNNNRFINNENSKFSLSPQCDLHSWGHQFESQAACSYSSDLLDDLLPVLHSCSPQGMATARITLEWPGSITPIANKHLVCWKYIHSISQSIFSTWVDVCHFSLVTLNEWTCKFHYTGYEGCVLSLSQFVININCNLCNWQWTIIKRHQN